MNQRFTDDEVARILSRAAELQNTRDEKHTSLEDIERAAAEAGIDVALVRAAARDVHLAPVRPTEAPGFFGPTQVLLSATVHGELPEAAKERLHEVVQQVSGVPMAVTAIGRTLDWQHQDPQSGRRLRVVVTSRDGQTDIRIEEPLGGLMGGIYGGVGGGAGSTVVMLAALAGVIAAGPVAGVAFGVAGGVASLFGTRSLYQAVARRRGKRAEAMLETLVGTVGELVVAKADDSLKAARERQGLVATDVEAPTAHEVQAAVEHHRR